jgi:hypothetical protein
MKPNTVLRLVLILVCVGLTACTAFELRDANDQLTTYYYAKKQAENNKDWQMLEGTIASLSKLAKDAASQAEKEKGNVSNQIAFYRIATTAAWQAGDTNILAYADKGKDLCSEENFKLAPRDCNMLILFPLFASVDEITKEFESLQKKVTEEPADQRKVHAPAAEKIFSDYEAALSTILKQRPKVVSSDAHPDFLNALDRRTGDLLCTLIGMNSVGLITTAKGDANKAVCDVYKLKVQAFDGGLRSSDASCLPESKDQFREPQGCQ